MDSSAYGNWGKVIVHEWAKLRWGVFEEHGYPGDDQFPMFFYKVSSASPGGASIDQSHPDNLRGEWTQTGVNPKLLCQQPPVWLRAGHDDWR